jgi:hypothetical protein
MKENTEGYIELTLEFRKNEGLKVWEARCVELGTATSADTFEQAQEEILEFIDLQLNALEELGERERFFKENGIQIKKEIPSAPKNLKIPRESGLLISNIIQPVHLHIALA